MENDNITVILEHLENTITQETLLAYLEDSKNITLTFFQKILSPSKQNSSNKKITPMKVKCSIKNPFIGKAKLTISLIKSVIIENLDGDTIPNTQS